MTATMKPYVNWDALLKKLAWLPVDQMSRAFTDHEAKNEVLGVKRAEEIMVILEDALPLLSLSPVEQAPQPVEETLSRGIKRYDEHPDGGGMTEDVLGAYVKSEDILHLLAGRHQS